MAILNWLILMANSDVLDELVTVFLSGIGHFFSVLCTLYLRNWQENSGIGHILGELAISEYNKG